MPRKTNSTPSKIIELYMEAVLLGNTPKSVYAFAKQHKFDESEFYTHYSSFDVLEKEIFAAFCTKTLALLLDNNDYKTYNAKSKLLSFYYTFFELLTANRSYVFLKLKDNKNKLESIKLLTNLRKKYIAFVGSEIYTDTLDLKNKTINKVRDKSILEAAWIQLLFTLQFWLEDTSANFEKTDIFIEKSVKASFDLKDLTPIQSVFDFAKFLWKEKMPTI